MDSGLNRLSADVVFLTILVMFRKCTDSLSGLNRLSADVVFLTQVVEYATCKVTEVSIAFRLMWSF